MLLCRYGEKKRGARSHLLCGVCRAHVVDDADMRRGTTTVTIWGCWEMCEECPGTRHTEM